MYNMVKFFKTYHLYIIGFTALIISALFLNWNCPPNFDESHAYNIARYLSPVEIFTISKTEGHPFAWYFLLMPFAKIHFGYPYIIYALNLIAILGAFYFLYKYAPLPTITKYFITFSAPILQLYTPLARSYSLTLLLLFSILSLYTKRHQLRIIYLSLIVLLANTSAIGFSLALPLGLLYFKETLSQAKENSIPLLQTINFGLLEILLLLAQFYGYDTTIPSHTPILPSVKESLTATFYPLNIPCFALFVIISALILYKSKRFQSLFFLICVYITLLTLFIFIHRGGVQHHNFFYITLIAAFWLGGIEKKPLLNAKQIFPLSFLAFALIFNPNSNDKLNALEHLKSLRQSAIALNEQFPKQQTQIFILDPLFSDVILPYLNPNITLLNQSASNSASLKGLQQFLYYYYVPINADTLLKTAQTTPNTWLLRTCEEPQYMHDKILFNLKIRLTPKYCLYDIVKR